MALKLIVKRDGTRQLFDKMKIVDAVLAAFEEVDGEITDYAEIKAGNIADYIAEKAEEKELGIEEIQDLVERGLMSTRRKDVARAYIVYRENRTRERNKNNALIKAVGEKLMAKNVQNQNANVDEASFGGRRGEAGDAVLKQYALDYLISPKHRRNHLENRVYIHDLNSYALGMHNCCARETKFCTTNDGVRSFEDYKDGDKVEVLTPYNVHKTATVHEYGVQKLNKITFSFAGQRFVTERFTANHRWILADETETTNLKIGDKLKKAPVSIRKFVFEVASEQEKYYWCLGFILADGTEAYRWSHGQKKEDIKFVRMRLCGDKVKYEPRFSMLKHSTKEMQNGDLYLTFSSVIGLRKIFPDLSKMTRGEKHALMNGIYDADGQHVGSRKSILITDEQIASFIEDEAPSLGWFILNINDKTGEKTNYKTRGFSKEYTFIGDANKYYWTVTDIQEDKEETVWCLEVEDLHSFVLPNGITTGNCLSIPFDDLLAKGFTVRNGINVRPAGSVSTAFQLIAVIMQIQSLQQFGGVSSTHLDWTLVPYVRKTFYKNYKFYIEEIEEQELDYSFLDCLPIDESDYQIYNNKAFKYALKMTQREVRQGAESLFHNLNTLQSRSGNQLPFSSINFGTCTLAEGRMVTEALLLACLDGIGKFHTTSIFPCVIFQMKKGCNYPGDPNYDLFKLAQKCTAQRDYPNYANCDWSGNAGYDPNDPRTWFSTMGCRTANSWDVNGLGQLKDGRGNIAPATIILPTIAMEAATYYENKPCGDLEEDTIDFFFQLLEEAIDDCKDELLERFEYICSQPAEAARFMYENNTMAGYVPKEGIRSALKHGTLAIGQLGLAECLEILIRKNQTTEKGMELAKRIEQLFKDKCAEFKQTYKLNFGVYFTPAESLAYTAMQKFKARYGEIPKISDREYFTNSIHVPVWQDMTCMEKIDIESQLTGYSSAGCITYVELPGGIKNNLDALETIILYAMDHDIPYFAVNVPIDTCMECGYTDELNDTCPQCGSHKIYRIRRVTGYLTGNYTETFNKGKQAEVQDRVKHFKEITG